MSLTPSVSLHGRRRQIYHAFTQQKTAVSSKKLLHLVGLALDHILGDAVDVLKSDKQKEDLYKAMDPLAPAVDESVEDVLGVPKYSWQDKGANRPQSWPALIQDAEVLQISSKRASVLKRIPLFAEIPRVPTNNAPRTLAGDTEKVACDRQVGTAMRLLATAKILHEDEHAVDSLQLEAPSARSLFNIACVLLAFLSFSIEWSHKQALNKAIAEFATLNPTLFGKEDLAILQHISKLGKHLHRQGGQRYHPFRPFSRCDQGEGKGKGKGQPHFCPAFVDKTPEQK